jgi:hypothetical protein
MANQDVRRGLVPVRYASGAPYNGAANLYMAPATYGTAIFLGDAVVRTGAADARGVPEVNRATVGDSNAITGAVVGFVSGKNAGQGPPDPDNLKVRHGPASTLRYILVADDPTLQFEIQADSAGTIVAAQVGLNAVLIDTHAGDADTGLSGTELDTDSDPPAADASNQLTILRLADREDNEFGAHAKLLVRINNHTEAHGALGLD